MSPKRCTHFTVEETRTIGNNLGVDWCKFDIEQFRMGLEVELEHGYDNLTTDVTHNSPILTGKIVLAHLNEYPDYYTRLEKMKEEAKHDYHWREFEPRDWR